VSARAEILDKMAAFEQGAVDYVTKPFEAGEVLARVATQLQLSRMRRELALRNRELQMANDIKDRFLGWPPTTCARPSPWCWPTRTCCCSTSPCPRVPRVRGRDP